MLQDGRSDGSFLGVLQASFEHERGQVNLLSESASIEFDASLLGIAPSHMTTDANLFPTAWNPKSKSHSLAHA
jgi:hypothetical protein